MIFKTFLRFILLLSISVSAFNYSSSYATFHDIDTCFDVSTIEVQNNIYPLNEQNGSNQIDAKLQDIYLDTVNNIFYSDLTLDSVRVNANLEKITNRCVYIYGNRLVKNQTENFQLGLEIASVNNAYFYVEKNLYIDDTVYIKSNTTLIGIDNAEKKAQIAPYLNSVSYLLFVRKNAENIEFRNLKIREVRDIDQGFAIFLGNNKNIQIKSVDFEGKDIDPNKRTRGLFFTGEMQENVLIRDSSFSDIEYSIQIFSPIEGLQVLKNTFTKWSHYALLSNISGQIQDGQSKDIEIRHNEFIKAAAGGDRGVILISPGDSVRYVTNVDITSNIVQGNKGSFIKKSNDPDFENNNAHGDQIVLHRVNNFRITNNDVFDGGENGITTSRLSRNGTISNNRVYDNDGNGFSVGSAYFELHLDNKDGLEIGDRIQGKLSKSEGTITNIYPEHNIIGIERVNASSKIITGPTFLNEPITLLNRTLTDEKNITVVDRTKLIDILDNEIYSNGHNSAKEHADGIFSGVYVINSDTINFRRNHFYNGHETLIQKWAITASRSRNLFDDGTNLYEDTSLSDSAIQLQAHSWMRE